jgi:excisionase family DNA binding protein
VARKTRKFQIRLANDELMMLEWLAGFFFAQSERHSTAFDPRGLRETPPMAITINLPPEPDDDTDLAHLRRAAAKAALPDELQIFTPPEVAAMLGVSSDKVYAWLRAGQLQSVPFGSQRRVRASDLAEYISSH